jgi:type II secretory pathway pseudopilin PulG
MKFYQVQKRMITLIEIMIVMFLIALITGVLAYNYQGSLEEGKAFKTKVGMERLETILNLAAAQDPDVQENISGRWKEVVQSSPLVQNPKDLIYDGWGNEYRVEKGNDGKITITSEGLRNYQQKK